MQQAERGRSTMRDALERAGAHTAAVALRWAVAVPDCRLEASAWLPVVVLGLDTDPARDRWAAEVRRADYAAATQARSLLLLVVGDPEVVRGLGLDDLAEQLERLAYLADVTAEAGGSRVVSSPRALLCAGEVVLECIAGHLGPGLVFLLGALIEESFEGLRYPDSDARALALLAGEGRTTGTSELADGAGNAQLLLWRSVSDETSHR